jgi:hypothetical protein
MKTIFDELPDWEFEVTEVSAGVYTVVACDRKGRRVAITGVDPEAMLIECKLTATEMANEATRSANVKD